MNGDSRIQSVEARRNFLLVTASAGVVLASCAAPARGAESPSTGEKAEAEVTPAEDLMQEHGVIERILLIYEESARRIEQNEPLELAVVNGAATIVRRFVAEYHEKQEEQFVFPRLEAAKRETALVATLLRQHERGREVTDDIAKRAQATAPTPALAQALRSFVRMYRPHAAREDTVLFPAFREVVGPSAYRELGEKFEDKEHELFGEHGFEKIVAEVARLEAALKIDALDAFTA